MTVRINKPAINLREELATLKKQVGYQEQQFWFDNLVTNGTFDTVTDWSLVGAGVSISDGNGVFTSAGSGQGFRQEILEMGIMYQVTFDIIELTSGAVGIGMGFNTISTGNNSVGTYTVNGTPSSNVSFNIYAQGTTTAKIDNVSVYPVDPSDNAPWHKMPKGWLPLHVYEDGLLLREGASHDYEVIYDGFDYYVKPTVAPGPNTETCVIGVKA